MGDKFGRTVEVVVPKGRDIDDLWDLLESTWETALEGQVKRAGLPAGWEARGSTSDNRSFGRESVKELRQAFESNHAVPRSVDLVAFMGPKVGGVDFVKIWAWFGIGDASIKISVSGASRIDVERFSHDLMERVSSSKQISRIAPEAEITHHPLILSSSDDGTQKAASPVRQVKESVDQAKDSKGSDSWLKRKWRDQAAMLVITVVGGVLVLVVAAWLGLNAPG